MGFRGCGGGYRHYWGPTSSLGPLLTLGDLGEAWAFQSLSLSSTLVCISAAILGRMEQSFSEHPLSATRHFTVLQSPGAGGYSPEEAGILAGHLLGPTCLQGAGPFCLPAAAHRPWAWPPLTEPPTPPTQATWWQQ